MFISIVFQIMSLFLKYFLTRLLSKSGGVSARTRCYCCMKYRSKHTISYLLSRLNSTVPQFEQDKCDESEEKRSSLEIVLDRLSRKVPPKWFLSRYTMTPPLSVKIEEEDLEERFVSSEDEQIDLTAAASNVGVRKNFSGFFRRILVFCERFYQVYLDGRT